jgi:hypothetical protein
MSQHIDTSLLQNLDDSARKEVLEFIQQESSKAKIQTSVTQFTNMCFKKCIIKDITNSNLDSTEEACVTDCLNRFLDTNIKVVQILQSMQK